MAKEAFNKDIVGALQDTVDVFDHRGQVVYDCVIAAAYVRYLSLQDVYDKVAGTSYQVDAFWDAVLPASLAALNNARLRHGFQVDFDDFIAAYDRNEVVRRGDGDFNALLLDVIDRFIEADLEFPPDLDYLDNVHS